MRRLYCAWLLVSFGLFGSSGLAAASDFMDVRLTWLLGDPNLLVEPGETSGDAPGFGLGEGKRTFFDNYETKYSGFETLGHLVLTRAMPAFWHDFGAEASLFLSLQVAGTQAIGLRDEGSFIRMYWDFSGGLADDENLELVLHPISGDRFRMGYSYRASWGGDAIFRQADWLSPAARLQLNLGWGYAFFGFKTARIVENLGDSQQTERVQNHGLLAGLGLDVAGFVAEAKGAYFTRGTFPSEDLRGRGLYASGLSYQLGYHRGTPIGRSIDFELYRNDPELEQSFFAPERYEEGWSLRVQHEGSLLWQTLGDAERPGQTVDQLGWAFDLNLALKWNFLRIHLDVLAQSLGFMLHEVPGFTPLLDFPAGSKTSPQIWAALGVDYHFEGPRLTAGLKLGVQQPASYQVENLEVDGVLFGRRTVVVRGPIQRDILPEGEEALPIWVVKASLRWDFAEMLGLVAELYYTYDDNQVRYVSDAFGLNVISEFVDPHGLGVNLMAQARF